MGAIFDSKGKRIAKSIKAFKHKFRMRAHTFGDKSLELADTCEIQPGIYKEVFKNGTEITFKLTYKAKNLRGYTKTGKGTKSPAVWRAKGAVGRLHFISCTNAND